MKKFLLVVMAIVCVLPTHAEEKVYARVYCKAPTTRFDNGSVANPDRGIGKYENVPESYSKWKVTFAPSDRKAPLEFKVKEAGFVSVITIGRSNDYLKNEGWKKVGAANVDWPKDPNNVTGERVLYKITIYEKYLEEGEYELRSDNKGFGPPRLLKKK